LAKIPVSDFVETNKLLKLFEIGVSDNDVTVIDEPSKLSERLTKHDINQHRYEPARRDN
jgi:hypothetical protein